MSESVAIFTGKDLAVFREQGGSGYWRVKPERVAKAQYALAIRNLRESYAVTSDGMAHGQAFLIARIAGCTSAGPVAGRQLITFDQIAMLPDNDQFKNAWKRLTGGQRFPVKYLETDSLLITLGLSPDQLEWQAF